MAEQKKYTCDICNKKIKKGHQELYMATININGYTYHFDDGGEHWSKTYHVHNDNSNRCLKKIDSLLNNDKKAKENLEEKTK